MLKFIILWVVFALTYLYFDYKKFSTCNDGELLSDLLGGLIINAECLIYMLIELITWLIIFYVFDLKLPF